jgi:hypothetical protein
VVAVKLEVTVSVVQKPQARSHMPALSLGQSGQKRMLHTSPSQVLEAGSVHVLQKASSARFTITHSVEVDVSEPVDTEVEDDAVVVVPVAEVVLLEVVLRLEVVLTEVVLLSEVVWVSVMSVAQIWQDVSHMCA